MSLAILQTPPSFTSYNGDVIYTVINAAAVADPTTYPNYKYIADIYINTVLIARIKKVPDPITGVGVFNIGQMIRNYASTSLDPAPNVLVAQVMGSAVFWLSVVVKMGEEYGGTGYLNVVTDSARTFFNSYNKRLAGITSQLSLYQDKVASNRPTTTSTFLSTSFLFLSYFPTTTTPVFVTVTPSGGGIPLTTSFVPDNPYDLQVLNISPQALNAIQSGTINAATTSYSVLIGSQTYRVNLICESQYTPYIIHFQNQYGGFDTKKFTKVSRTSFDITRTAYGLLPYRVDGSGNVTYKTLTNVYYPQTSNYAVQFTENLVLNSDFITDNEYVWLTDLYVSPNVYLEQNGYIYPINLPDTSYEQHKNVNDDLTSITLNIKFGNLLNTQLA